MYIDFNAVVYYASETKHSTP